MKNKRNYVNYHSHKMEANVFIADSPVSYTDYIERAKELGQRVVTSVEHGYQGNYFKLNEEIQKENIELRKRRDKGEENVPQDLKFVFGTEAYWVKDRHPKIVIDEETGKEKKVNDGSNCHMVLLAKNDNGRKAINYVLSLANEDGIFNNRPRLDFDLLFQLPPNDVFVTSACIGYWNKYDDIADITLKFKEYFGDNFYLEVQANDTEPQKQLNKFILEFSKKHNIPIIAGTDSHYIYEYQSDLRDTVLKYKGINYPDEEGWYMDYPSYDELFERFQKQGILSDEEIEIALNNTNIIETFEDIDLDLKIIEKVDDKTGKKDYELFSPIKLPTIYKDKTQKEKDWILANTIKEEWDKFKVEESIKPEEEEQYLEGIKYELGEVLKTGMSDYFLLHYVGLKRGKEVYHGHITKRGRGSGVGYFINTLLGFSKVDRFKAPVKLYPERFLTSDRILKSRALPDIDNNVSEQEPFVLAFQDLLGKYGIYPMVAFGTLKESSAIKLYMGANNEPPNIQDEVSKQLKKYDEALKYCDDEEDKKDIHIEDYIEPQYLHYVEDSKPYQGIIVSKTPHPCGHLLLNGDIRKEIGTIACISKTTGKKVICACIDGQTADHYKFLKTDLLIVDIVGLTEEIWERIGEKSISNTELERRLACEEGNKAWEMYEKGYTMCVNQCEKDGTRKKAMRFKIRNTAELTMFVAGIRPAFKSLINNFLDRKPYTTGVPELDEVLKDSYHYLLYQESIMAFLNWLGIDMKETYDIVKKISKKIFLKHPEQMVELKNKTRPNWIKNTGSEELFDETFQAVEDAGSYAFNSAHAYCVGNDGAEIAYLKAYYPYETYEVCLNRYTKKDNKDKVALLKKEMKEAFNIDVGKLMWGLDNRQYTLDKENHCINPCLSSIKGIRKTLAEELYDLSQKKNYDNFIDVLIDIFQFTNADGTMVENLIKLNYFEPFGKSKTLLRMYQVYQQFYKKEKCIVQARKVFDKEKMSEPLKEIFRRTSCRETEKQFRNLDVPKIVNEIIGTYPDEELPITVVAERQNELLGYIDVKDETYDSSIAIVTQVKINRYGTPFFDLYQIKTGNKIEGLKVDKDFFLNFPIQDEVFTTIYIGNIDIKPKKRKNKETNKWEDTGEMQQILKSYEPIFL